MAHSSKSPGTRFEWQPVINANPEQEQWEYGSTREGALPCHVSVSNRCSEVFHMQIKFTQIIKEQRKKNPHHSYMDVLSTAVTVAVTE